MGMCSVCIEMGLEKALARFSREPWESSGYTVGDIPGQRLWWGGVAGPEAMGECNRLADEQPDTIHGVVHR